MFSSHQMKVKFQFCMNTYLVKCNLSYNILAISIYNYIKNIETLLRSTFIYWILKTSSQDLSHTSVIDQDEEAKEFKYCCHKLKDKTSI